MRPKYHSKVTTQALTPYFDTIALDQIITANLSQDKWPNINFLGNKSHIHFNNDKISESIFYIAAEHEVIVRSIENSDHGEAQRAALGRLTHTVQDFYSHSNYVQLWLESNGRNDPLTTMIIDGMDENVLNDPALHTCYFFLWRDFIYYVPILKKIVRRLFVPKHSHEEMHLDGPERGPLFPLSLIAAIQRTKYEYMKAVQTLYKVGGQAAVDQFHRSNA